MTKEQLIALGLTEEQATKVVAASQEELKSFIPKSRFDEVTEENKTLKTTVKASETQLETLKTAAGASEELKTQIASLQAENTATKQQHEADLKGITLTNAIKSALNGKVHDESLVAGLFDKDKLVIDGEKVVGLEEQLKSLQESKAFLFVPEGGTGGQGGTGFKVGNGGNAEGGTATNEQLASIFGNTKQ